MIINCQKEVEPGTVGVVRYRGETLVRRVMKDRNGWYLRSDNTSYNIIRPEGEEEVSFDVTGGVIAVQRVVAPL